MIQKNKTLFEALKYAEGINERIESTTAMLQSYLKHFGDLSGFENFTEIPKVDSTEYQIRTIQEYKSNPILDKALRGDQSIEKSFEEVSKVNKGIKKFFPRRKNLIHNLKLELLGELIGECNYLKTRGIFSPDNSFVGFVYGVSTGVAMFAFGKLFIWSSGDINPGNIERSEVLFSVISLYLGCGGLMAQVGRIDSSNINHQENAQYLDKKIEELY